MYPILNKLEQSGLIMSEKVKVEGKIRKYYSITGTGSEVLREAKEKIRELAEEVLEGTP